MTIFTPRTHVSTALASLRSCVTFAAVVVVLMAIAQALIFGVAHFTELRWTTIEKPVEQQPFRVVSTPDGTAVATPPTATETPGPTSTAKETERVLSRVDGILAICSQVVVTFGIIACAGLCVLTVLGVVIAAGPSVPGIERTVSACAWALFVALAAIPWRDVFSSTPWPGVFSDYSRMVALSAAVDAGGPGQTQLVGLYLIVPAIVAVIAGLVLVRFRMGVAEGIIDPTAQESGLEREMEQIRRRGITSANSMRTVVALNQAIADRPAPTPPPVPADAASDEEAPEEPSGPAIDPRAVDAAQRWAHAVARPKPGDPLKRVI